MWWTDDKKIMGSRSRNLRWRKYVYFVLLSFSINIVSHEPCVNLLTLTWPVSLQDCQVRTYHSYFTDMSIVYFDQLSGAACTPKLVKILFFASFYLFWKFSTLFIKTVPKNFGSKIVFDTSSAFLPFLEIWPAFACQPALKSLKLSFFKHFSWFQMKNHWKTFEMNKTGWKWPQKSILTSFWGHTESWSKYTTHEKTKIKETRYDLEPTWNTFPRPLPPGISGY